MRRLDGFLLVVFLILLEALNGKRLYPKTQIGGHEVFQVSSQSGKSEGSTTLIRTVSTLQGGLKKLLVDRPKSKRSIGPDSDDNEIAMVSKQK